MSTADDADYEQAVSDAKKRVRYRRQPARISEAVSQLLARRGYAQVQQCFESVQVWNEVVGKRLAAHSRVGRLQRGVLQITVRNSATLQELTFQKRKLLKQLQDSADASQIRDIRFRVGEIG